MQHSDSDKFRKAAVDAVDQAFEAGILEGIRQERARVKALLENDLRDTASPLSGDRPPAAARENYGKLSALVGAALQRLSPNGPIGADGIVKHLRLAGVEVSEKQASNVLRHLANVGKATRVKRGRYLAREASESPSAEEPGADTPGFFNLAAE